MVIHRIDVVKAIRLALGKNSAPHQHEGIDWEIWVPLIGCNLVGAQKPLGLNLGIFGLIEDALHRDAG